jgi:hypothetical protein
MEQYFKIINSSTTGLLMDVMFSCINAQMSKEYHELYNYQPPSFNSFLNSNEYSKGSNETNKLSTCGMLTKNFFTQN